MDAPGDRETNENGPVPIGLVVISPDSTLRRLTMANPLNPPMLVSRLGVGALTVNRTRRSSRAVIDAMASSLYALDSSSSIIRRKEYSTSAAVSGSPLWNVTPSRSVNVHCRPSGLTSQLSASAGRIWSCSSGSTRVSKTFSSTSKVK